MADIVVCAAHSVTRAGLSAMVAMPATDVVGVVNSVEALGQWLRSQSADLAVIATAAGFKTVLQIVDSLPVEDNLSVLILLEGDWIEVTETKSDDLSALMNTGIISLLPMNVSADRLRSAIAAILSGFNVIHPDITASLFTQSTFAFSTIDSDDIEPLTQREIQVLNQLASGLTNRAIAQALNISEHTVKFHISAILSKLYVSSRTEAVAVGIRNGLVTL
ncbi:MAG: response regulator transcription factor [Cyanobacteria bacterium J06621_3]